MAFVWLNEMSNKEIEIETLWLSYRKILLDFIEYLHGKGREKAFKLFFSRSIPDKNWDFDIEYWLLNLEQSGQLSMNQLGILCYFLQSFNDSEQIGSMIKEFQRRLHFVEMILKCDSVPSAGKSKLKSEVDALLYT